MTVANAAEAVERAQPAQTGLGRIVAVDAARGVAVAGMCLVHIQPDGGPRWLVELATGRSAALFAVLAGVSLALQTRSGQSRADARMARLRIVIRAVILFLLGLLLALMPSSVIIIVGFYAVCFVLLLPCLRWSARALAISAAVAAVAGPVLSFVVRDHLDSGGPTQLGGHPTFADLGHPAELVKLIFLTGTYPVLTWIPFLLAGLAVGRYLVDCRRGVSAPGIVTAGAVLTVAGYGGSWVAQYLLGGRDHLRVLVQPTVAGSDVTADQLLSIPGFGSSPTDSWWWLTLDNPHTGTPFDVLGSTGIAFLVLAAAVNLCRFRAMRAVLYPVIATGAMGLTSYCVHLVILAVVPPRRYEGDQIVTAGNISLWLYYGLLLVTLAVCAMVWLAFFRRGPLEAMMHRAVSVVKPRRRSIRNSIGRRASLIGRMKRRGPG